MGRYLPLLKRLMSLDITSADSNVERRTKESQHETGTTKLFVYCGVPTPWKVVGNSLGGGMGS